jgi:N,N'-diacetyllegionaminate synthase
VRTIIIAEAGVNHNGSIDMAKKLIDGASLAGADFVKFQTFKADELVVKGASKAKYQMIDGVAGEDQHSMLKRLELSFDAFSELKDYADLKGVKFLSTAFDQDSATFLRNIGQSIYKIPSGEITNIPLLRHIASFQSEVILSTGMSDLADIACAIRVLEDSGLKRSMITLLHCTSAYPTPVDEVNLRVMQTMRDAFGVRIGYSDHTEGCEVALAAVALGATVVEKHFTLDKGLPGPDHLASLEVNELRDMIRAIRIVENALGSSLKHVTTSEKINQQVARKSLVAKCRINTGDEFTELNVTTKRPENGIPAAFYDFIIGKRAIRDFLKDDLLEM